MNIEITENIIRGSIVYQLKQAFGDSYKYYDEEIEQGFEKPSFHVSRIDDISRKGYTGNQYKLVDNTYRYVIKYFTAEKNNKSKDINDKIDELKQIFNYLEIVNIKEEFTINDCEYYLNEIEDENLEFNAVQYCNDCNHFRLFLAYK